MATTVTIQSRSGATIVDKLRVEGVSLNDERGGDKCAHETL